MTREEERRKTSLGSLLSFPLFSARKCEMRKTNPSSSSLISDGPPHQIKRGEARPAKSAPEKKEKWKKRRFTMYRRKGKYMDVCMRRGGGLPFSFFFAECRRELFFLLSLFPSANVGKIKIARGTVRETLLQSKPIDEVYYYYSGKR